MTNMMRFYLFPLVAVLHATKGMTANHEDGNWNETSSLRGRLLLPKESIVRLPSPIGCYKDSGDERDMTGFWGSGGYGIHSCIQKCKSEGFLYAGLQYHHDCFCDDQFGSQGKVDDSECDKNCDIGDGFCGGSYRNSVFHVHLPSSIGCYNDSVERDMTGFRGSGYGIHSCIQKCKSEGFLYAGLQYYHHCFCDDQFGSQGKADDSECDKNCDIGDGVCGGSYRNSVFNVHLPSSLGCYKDSGDERDMTGFWGSGGYGIHSCIQKCKSEGFLYAGLQYHHDCFCDDQYGSQGKVDDSECNKICDIGDGVCGGSYRNSVFNVPETILNCMKKDLCMSPGDSIESFDDKHHILFQFDGNVVASFKDSGAVIWQTGTHDKGGKRFCMEENGNLVMYNSGGYSIWESNTRGTNAQLCAQNGGNVAIYAEEGLLFWQTKQTKCSGYFCDKTLSTMFIFMTHNSYASTAYKILSFNQEISVGEQFDHGIRGFNFDVYGNLKLDHCPDDYGCSSAHLSYSQVVTEIKERLEKDSNRNEIVVIEIEKKKGLNDDQYEKLSAEWGSLIMKDFDANKPFSYYIEKGQRVLLLIGHKSDNANVPDKGYYRRDKFVTQNNYQWHQALNNPNYGFREGPGTEEEKRKSAKMMNYFCTLHGLPTIVNSEIVNTPNRIMYSSRLFSKQPYAFGSLPNIIMLDFATTRGGDIWEAQELIRSGRNAFGNEWGDGTVCAAGTTCFNCLDTHQEYWYSKAFTACGEEPCWADGIHCGLGTTCNACCNGHEYWDSLWFTACGKEPCWADGSICGAGTTCKNCCNEAQDALGTKCGGDCWGYGKACGIGTTCNFCCKGYSWKLEHFFTTCD